MKLLVFSAKLLGLLVFACACSSSSTAERGTLSQACFEDLTCALDLNHRPLSCIAGKCVQSLIPEDGTLGSACDDTSPCISSALDCIHGRCEQIDCPSGTWGCPCGAYGSCLGLGSEIMACGADGLCEHKECAIQNEYCHQTPFSVAFALHEEAVACELILELRSEGNVHLRFDAQTYGRFEREAKQLAITWITRDQNKLPSTLGRLFIADIQRPRLISASCYKASGEVVEKQVITLE